MKEGHVIFDFDLTICSLVTDWVEWRKGVWKLVKEFDPSSNYEVEQIRHATQNDLIHKYGLVFKAQLDKANEELELKYIEGFLPNEKVVDFIRTTDKNLYVWSSNSRATVVKHLQALGIEDKFQKIVAREHVHLLKPSPEGFSLIYSPHNMLKEYVLVGDSASDANAALNAGIRFLQVDSF